MKHLQNISSIVRIRTANLVLLSAAIVFLSASATRSQGLLTLANPHWNITLSDFGYSDFLLDNTPGFEGREYLSGEWAAAVGYQVPGGPDVTPQWLEPLFVFPDWNTHSPFHVVTPLAQTGLNADGLPIAESVIANQHLEITLRHEMIDTVVGTPMGTRAASDAGTGAFISSDRYVLKQTCTVRNTSGGNLTQVQFFQFLHGLQSQRGVYDNRLYAGPWDAYRFDLIQAGVDSTAVGAGSSTAGLEDFIGFQASAVPSAFEVGYYGIEGNGVDDHSVGKPSDGVHLSVEDNWQTPPYSLRQGTDSFAPPQRWVAGAQRWGLGDLAPGQTASFDLLLSLRTGTRVTTGTGSTGGCNGGSSVAGGVDYEFEDVSSEGSCFAEYSQADASELEVHIAQGEFSSFTFLTPGEPAQVWEMEFSGTYSGAIHLTFGYDPTILPAGFDESVLCLYQFVGDAWQKLTGTVNPALHTIAVSVSSLSSFALGVEGGASFTVNANVLPPNSGTIAGAGTYADGASASLVATASAGYAFSNWTDNGSVVSTSPSYTFLVGEDRSVVANFISVGTAKVISTSSQPSNGGSTSGDGAYALGSSATVSATPNAGYKFSKWLDNGVVVSTARDYSFTVTGDRVLVAKFKPVYTVVVSAEPAEGGEVEADPVYEVGELAVLKAKPNNGYSFVNWTQNGVSVSTEAIYQFNVIGNRELVGHFALGHLIKPTALPAHAGTVSGGGVYPDGANVTITALAMPGYVFLNWTENGLPVSTTASYNLTSDASHTLVANFIAQPALTTTLTAPGVMTLSWPAGASGWTLQESPDLSPDSWRDSNRMETIVDGLKQVIVSPLAGTGFFRLVHP